MPLTYHLLTYTPQWPADADSLNAAISTQGPFRPVIDIQPETLLVTDPEQGLRPLARLLPYPAGAYESLLGAAQYGQRMTDRDRDTALPFQRLVEITTTADGPADEQTQALFHATVADGIWWLMGGFLADPYRKTVWGW